MTLRIAVLGTSIAWGQGLDRDKTFAAQLQQQLKAARGDDVILELYAHSGARLWRGDLARAPLKLDAPVDAADCLQRAAALHPAPQWPGSTQWRDFVGECPADEPYIWLQFIEASHDHSDPGRAADVVIVDIGANDVGALSSLEPGSGYQQLTRNLSGSIDPLLRAIHADAAFAKAAVLVVGYYEIISADSSSSRVPPGGSLSWFFPGLAGPLDDDCFAKMGAQSVDWVARMHNVLKADIHSANASSTKPFAYFVDPQIPASGALFGSKQVLFGPDKNGNAHDQARQHRVGAGGCCEQRAVSSFEKFFCQRASFGHPDVDGAKLYADRLFATCKALGLVP
jgi:hypothetical protein